MDITLRKSLDKFYTKPEIAKMVWNDFKSYLDSLSISDYIVVEPSAGDGKMLNEITTDKIGFDLAPETDDIIQNDFLTGDIKHYISKDMVFFGNPPFGKKGSLAIDFINKALTYGRVVGFIIPNQFKKYSVQNKINPNAKLVFEKDLPEDSFLLADKDYKVRCVFQIWSLEESDINLRVGKPVTVHSDFEMYQYNATKTAEKYFDYDWDFCVLRQGYGDFNQLYTKDDKDELSKKKQWIFFKAKNDKILAKLKSIDFDKLASLNTSTKGFGKHDLVKEYNSIS
jgi:hypothetical protein